MEKIIQLLIHNWVKGVDTYTNNGSTWLIFTDKKQWVIELTERKILWYNYTFFKQIFKFTSLDMVENQHYITKWVEDNIINKVSYTEIGWHQCNNIDDTIERGVKETNHVDVMKFFDNKMEGTLQNGVKETKTPGDGDITSTFQWMYENKTNSVPKMIDDIIDNGVKYTHSNENKKTRIINNVLEKGVKETRDWNESIIGDLNQYGCVDNVINNGVKETKGDASQNPMGKVTKIIENGIKETKWANRYKYIGPRYKEIKVQEILDKGIKKPTD
jgi:hypothetical protein